MAAASLPLGPDHPHTPVLITPLLDAVAPVSGHWIDGTFGAGGYARALLDAGAERVSGIDRDPYVFELAKDWADEFAGRLDLVQGNFAELDTLVEGPVQGVVLDLGVSSMQIDQPERGFSFLQDGPLDMRMSQSGKSAADIVNMAGESEIADILYHYGEERAARRIAHEIVAVRGDHPIETTAQLVSIVERCLPRKKPGQSHPATRSFQALRIAVNDEFGALLSGLEAAERCIAPGGALAVVSFHSLEDRIVKRFFQLGAGRGAGNRYAPEAQETPKRWRARNKGITASAPELSQNPRSRSATLRVGFRTDAPAAPVDRGAVGAPRLLLERKTK